MISHPSLERDDRRCETETTQRHSVRGGNFNAVKPEMSAQCDTTSETCTALCRKMHASSYTQEKKKKNLTKPSNAEHFNLLRPKTSALDQTEALLERLQTSNCKNGPEQWRSTYFPDLCPRSRTLLPNVKLGRRFPEVQIKLKLATVEGIFD